MARKNDVEVGIYGGSKEKGTINECSLPYRELGAPILHTIPAKLQEYTTSIPGSQQRPAVFL
jgi:hypothetical protein